MSWVFKTLLGQVASKKWLEIRSWRPCWGRFILLAYDLALSGKTFSIFENKMEEPENEHEMFRKMPP